MSDKYFLDTNILVYTFDFSAPDKQKTAQDLVAQALETGAGCISYQVVQEFLNVARAKFETPMSVHEALAYLDRVLRPLCVVNAGPHLWEDGLHTQERWQYSFYDALIIAAARQADCRILYSEDMQHGQTIDNLRLINPFKSQK